MFVCKLTLQVTKDYNFKFYQWNQQYTQCLEIVNLTIYL